MEVANINPITALLLLLCAQIHGANATMGDGAVDPLDLPLKRPPAWVYRPRSSALNTSVEVDDMGVIIVKVQHAPLPAITSAMVNWFLSGLSATQLLHPKDCKMYSRYLIWHPRDHIRIPNVTSLASPTSPLRLPPPLPFKLAVSPQEPDADYFNVAEFFGASAYYTRDSDPASYAQEAQMDMHLKMNIRAAKNPQNPSLVLWLFKRDNPRGAQRTFLLEHVWKEVPGVGLAVNSTLTIGIVNAGNLPTKLVRQLNKQRIAPVWHRNLSVQKMADKFIQHTVEEFGNLPQFLPTIYKGDYCN